MPHILGEWWELGDVQPRLSQYLDPTWTTSFRHCKRTKSFLRLKNWLESEDSGDWVLIMDNADNPSEFRNHKIYPAKGSKGN
jgi:hypothetical protein